MDESTMNSRPDRDVEVAVRMAPVVRVHAPNVCRQQCDVIGKASAQQVYSVVRTTRRGAS